MFAAIAATILFAGAVAAFGAAFPWFSQLAHPVAALGASGVPRAGIFNVLGFALPGLLAAGAAQSLRGRVAAAPYAARLGAQVLTLAGLAFAAQGLLPLDSHDLLSSGSRLHAAAWTAWWIAFAAGTALLALGLRGRTGGAPARAALACSIGALLFAILLPGLLPVGLSQRVAYGLWWVAMLLLVAPSRGAASARGSSPTGRA